MVISLLNLSCTIDTASRGDNSSCLTLLLKTDHRLLGAIVKQNDQLSSRAAVAKDKGNILVSSTVLIFFTFSITPVGNVTFSNCYDPM